MNRYNFFGTISVFGIIIYAFGVWSKITHQAWSNSILSIGLILCTVGLAAFVWLLFMWLKEKNK